MKHYAPTLLLACLLACEGFVAGAFFVCFWSPNLHFIEGKKEKSVTMSTVSDNEVGRKFSVIKKNICAKVIRRGSAPCAGIGGLLYTEHLLQFFTPFVKNNF